MFGLIAVAVALAACGGSGSSSQDAAAVKACQQQGASQAACQCALSYAEAHGDTAAKLEREMKAKTAINDPVAVKAGVLCASR